MARVLTVIWMLAGLIIQGLFVATVTMSLVSQSLDVDFKLYGNKVTRLTNSSCKGRQCVILALNNPAQFFKMFNNHVFSLFFYRLLLFRIRLNIALD